MSLSISCHFIDDLSFWTVVCRKYPDPLIEVEPSWNLFTLWLSIYSREFSVLQDLWGTQIFYKNQLLEDSKMSFIDKASL